MFHNVLFPPQISYGSKGGPRFSTTVITLASGKERRNQNWIDVRAEYDVAHGIKDADQMEELREFFYARRGKAYSFRFYDPADYQLVNQSLGTGDGTTKEFQIVKVYSPEANPYTRKITKPVEGTLSGLFVGTGPLVEMVEVDWDDDAADQQGNFNALPVEDRPKGFAVNYLTGIVRFNIAPEVGAQIILGVVDFHVHVRFDTDVFDAVHEFWQTESWEQILLVEIKDAI